MDTKQKELNITTIKEVLRQYLQEKGFRNTPERYTILEEIYNMEHHFNVDDLYLLMMQKKYHVSKATIYNTIEIFLDAGLIRKHQFGEKTLTSSSYEKSYFDKQHDHLVIYKKDSDKEIEEIIEFCDPRIQGIKEAIESAFGVTIDSHSLYFYGTKKINEEFFVLFLLISANVFSQITTKPQDPLVKDPYFNRAQNAPQGEKVKLIHSDFFQKTPEKYNGNPYFSGNVRFEHQGSLLSADEVIFYEEQNFVKAIGNVKLQNADGSVITAGEMEYDGNSQKGIAKKNVVLTDPKQTIKTETLYYDRLSNKAYFNTGGTISDATNVMYTKSATYDLSSKMIDFTGNVKINNPDYIVKGTNIKQNQNNNTADFFGPTTITNKQNPSNLVYTERGSYNMNSKEVYLKKNSRIHYNDKILTGDDMYFNQITGFGTAKGNVTLRDPKERRYMKGGYGEIYEKKDSAMMTERPYAVKILEKDSMYFSAEKILAYQKIDQNNPLKKKSFLRAYRKSRMFKSNIQVRADSLSFNETDGIMHLFGKPIAWSGEKQVTGDKIEAYFDTENEFIDSLKVVGNAFAISKADSLNLKDEFNQVKGKLMTVYYQQNEIKLAKVIGNAQAITYADDQNEKTKETERIGVSLSTCGTIEAEFEERRVQIISCNVGANTDIYPMSKIAREKRFFPDFNWNTKDRLRKWEDIFLDSPGYEEVKYESDDALYNAAQKANDDAKKKEEAKKPKRVRK